MSGSSTVSVTQQRFNKYRRMNDSWCKIWVEIKQKRYCTKHPECSLKIEYSLVDAEKLTIFEQFERTVCPSSPSLS